jgi:hypothetical protein
MSTRYSSIQRRTWQWYRDATRAVRFVSWQPRMTTVVLTDRQRELVRLALYAYRTTDWTKTEINEVLDLFRGSEVRIYHSDALGAVTIPEDAR